MRTNLRVMALVLFVGTIGYWVAAGANRGWTRTSVPKKVVDEVTGIEGVTYEKKFVPGVEFPAVATGVALALTGISFLFRTKSTARASNEQSTNQQT